MSTVLGAAILRVLLGAAFATHGTQKLFGWFGGYGLAGTGGFFESIGFRPGRLFAAAAGLGELLGGLLTAFGFLGPVGPALVLSVMLVATIAVHLKNGFFAQNNGYEMPFVYTVAALPYALTGFGPFSLDAALGVTLFGSTTAIWSVLGAGVLGSIAALATRRQTTQAQPAA